MKAAAEGVCVAFDPLYEITICIPEGLEFTHAALTDPVAQLTVNLQTLRGWKNTTSKTPKSSVVLTLEPLVSDHCFDCVTGNIEQSDVQERKVRFYTITNIHHKSDFSQCIQNKCVHNREDVLNATLLGSRFPKSVTLRHIMPNVYI